MKNRVLKSTAAVLLVFWFSSFFAIADAKDDLSARAEEDLCAKADAVYLEMHDEYTLNEDGSTIHRHSHKVKLLTYYSFHRLLGESFIVYNPEYQELKIYRSRTTMADGKEVDSTPNAFNEVLPAFCSMAPPYMGLREMVVTHLGTERQAVLELDYEIRSKAGFVPFLMGEEIFADAHPILKKKVDIHVPKGTVLKSRLFNSDADVAVTDGGSFTTYSWSLTDLPLVPGEAMKADSADFAPHLVFSTCPSWDEAAKTLAERFEATCCTMSAADEALAALVKKSDDPVALMRAVNRFVADDVAGVAIDPALLGYRLRPAAETFASSLGSSFDRAALLAALLGKAGLCAKPVLLSRHCNVADDVPSWHQFNDCRVVCTPGGGAAHPVVLDPARVVGSSVDERMAGRTLFSPLSKGDKLHALPKSCKCTNRVAADLDLVLDEQNRLTGRVRLTVAGGLNPFLQLTVGSETWAAQRMARLVPGAQFDGVRATRLSETESVFVGSIKTPVALSVSNGLIEYTLPGCPDGAIDMHLPLAAETRATPLRLPRAVTETVNLELSLPEGTKVVVAPESAEMIGLPASMNTTLSVDGAVLKAKRSLWVRQSIAAEDYPALRAVLIEWSAPDARRVILEPKS